MPHSFDYAVVRVVPRVERGEFLNAGVILFCRELRYLGAAIDLDDSRLLALDPAADLAEVRAHLTVIPRICAGLPEAGAIAALPQADRFHWLAAPRSTCIQTSPTHCGLCTEPGPALQELLDRLVRMPVPRFASPGE